MHDFKPGDTIVDVSCTDPHYYGYNAHGLLGVCSRVEHGRVYGAWRYGKGWVSDLWSNREDVQPYDDADGSVLASYVAWKLTHG
jgi:hypothetical protein